MEKGCIFAAHLKFYTMAKITFRLSSKPNPILLKQSKKTTAAFEVLVRFRHGAGGKIDQSGKTNILALKSYTDPSGNKKELWDTKKGEPKDPSFKQHSNKSDEQKKLEQDIADEVKSTKDKLFALKSEIEEAFKEAGGGKGNDPLPKDWLEKLLSKEEPKEEAEQPPTFFEAFETYINGKKFSDNRRRHYQVLCRILKRYELFTNKPLTFDDLTADTLRDFEDFLKEEHIYYKKAVEQTEKAKGKKIGKTYLDFMEAVPLSRTPEPRGENAISDLMRRFRAFVRWANGLDKEYKLEKPYTNNNPFNAYSVPKEIYGTPVYITIEERNQLYNTQLDEPLATQRDIFIFQCCIGCRVSDLWAMTKASIIDGAIEYIPRKTKEGNPITVRVPLNKQATAIVEKYKDYEGKGLFPFTSQQEYNRSIKEIFEAANITRMVTVLNPTTREEEKHPIYEVASSHMARRTFVGNLYKKVKDPNAIGELSGHAEGSRAFKRYRAIDEETKKELVSMLD